MLLRTPRAARTALHDVVNANWGRLLVDQEAAACECLRARISDLLATVREPEIFEQRLFALAREAAILDGVQLVRLTQTYLPKDARSLRSAGRRVMRRLHVAAASECEKTGYPRLAARHLVRGVLMEPALLFRRRSMGILARSFIGRNSRNRLLRREVASVFRLFNERGIRACIFGSFAISLHAGKFVKRHGDIDLVLRSPADTDRAAALLVDERNYRVVRRHDWTGLTGERCFHIGLCAPSGIPIELSYLPENPSVKEQALVVDGVPVCMADLRGLRSIYALFLVKKAATSHDLEKQSKKNAIMTIDRLLAAGAIYGQLPPA